MTTTTTTPTAVVEIAQRAIDRAFELCPKLRSRERFIVQSGDAWASDPLTRDELVPYVAGCVYGFDLRLPNELASYYPAHDGDTWVDLPLLDEDGQYAGLSVAAGDTPEVCEGCGDTSSCETMPVGAGWKLVVQAGAAHTVGDVSRDSSTMAAEVRS